MVKLDVDTLATVPAAPPDAGPDRALPPPPGAAAEGDVAVAEDVPQAAESPITAHISAAPMINRLLLFDRNPHTPRWRRCLAMGTEADESDKDAGGGGPGVALEAGRAGTVSWGLVG